KNARVRLHMIDTTLKSKRDKADEEESQHGVVRQSRRNTQGHENGADDDHGFAGLVRGPSVPNQSPGGPTTHQTSRVGSHIWHPGKKADLRQTKTANSAEIQRQPGNVKPPNRIGQEAR